MNYKNVTAATAHNTARVMWDAAGDPHSDNIKPFIGAASRYDVEDATRLGIWDATAPSTTNTIDAVSDFARNL